MAQPKTQYLELWQEVPDLNMKQKLQEDFYCSSTSFLDFEVILGADSSYQRSISSRSLQTLEQGLTKYRFDLLKGC
jgi:hypothetical protein